MIVTFLVLSFSVLCVTIYRLRSYSTEQKKILNTDKDYLALCKEEWDRQHELMKVDPAWEIYHNEKYDVYDKWMKLTYGNLNPEKDCATISAALVLLSVVGNFTLFHKTIDIEEIIVPMILSGLLGTALGVIIGGPASLLVERLYKGKTRNIRYWIVCVGACLVCVIAVLLIFYYCRDYEYERGG